MQNLNTQSQQALEYAYQKFLDGWKTRNWQPFFDLLSDDLIFQYPAGPFKGRHLTPEGKHKLMDWARYHSESGDCIQAEPTQKIFSNDWGIFCENSTGLYNGKRYDGNEVIFLRIFEGKIVEYREYIGDITGWM